MSIPSQTKQLIMSMVALACLFVFGAPSQAFAINDVSINANTDFLIDTADTAVATTITASAGGLVTQFDVGANFIDITIDNASTVVFNVVTLNRYFSVTLQSGSANYTVAPLCPTNNVTITGTGAQAVLRLEVATTIAVCTAGGGRPRGSGGGGGSLGTLNAFASGVGTSEGGASVTLTIIASSAPGYDVTIPVTSSDTTEGTVPATLTILAGNTSGTVTITGVDDALADGPMPYTITFGASSSTDSAFNGVTPTPVILNMANMDNEAAGGGGGGGGGTGGTGGTSGGTSGGTTGGAPNSVNTTFTGEVPFTDVQDHWAFEYIRQLYGANVLSGRTPTAFEPDANLNRAEIVKVALLAFGYAVPETTGESPFSDVSSDAWYAKYVVAAKAAGIVNGYEDGTFQPGKLVNRAEALTIFLRASGLSVSSSPRSPFLDVLESDWFAEVVDYAFSQGVVNGKTPTLFAPGDNVTRAEMAKIVVKLLGLL